MEDNENLKVCKVVLLGETGVGKTCIIGRFIDDIFDDGQSATIIASFRSKTMTFENNQGQSVSVRFEVWDTAGQEKYRALNRVFYKDAGAAILVYDVTNIESFKEIQNYWCNQIKENTSKNISKKIFIFYFYFLVIGLAGNKSDLFDKEEVREEEAQNYAKEIGAIFRLTSACTSLGIEELFKCIGCKLLDPNYKDDDKGVKLEPSNARNDIRKKYNCC